MGADHHKIRQRDSCWVLGTTKSDGGVPADCWAPLIYGCRPPQNQTEGSLLSAVYHQIRQRDPCWVQGTTNFWVLGNTKSDGGIPAGCLAPPNQTEGSLLFAGPHLFLSASHHLFLGAGHHQIRQRDSCWVLGTTNSDGGIPAGC